jgi:hypothetical protein
MITEMQAFHNNAQRIIDAGLGNDIDLWMSDLVEEVRFAEFLKTESRFARAKAKARGQTLNSMIRKYNNEITHRLRSV